LDAYIQTEKSLIPLRIRALISPPQIKSIRLPQGFSFDKFLFHHYISDMCGRFVRITPIPVIAKKFRAQQMFADLAPSYNLAPSQEIVIINDEGVRQLVQYTWGFVPSWAKDFSIGNKMINARSETVAEPPKNCRYPPSGSFLGEICAPSQLLIF
jgi:hypothetical protein